MEPGRAVRPRRIVFAGRLLFAFDFKGFAGLGVLDGAVLFFHEEGDLVGADFHAAFPGAVFGLVGVVLHVADHAHEGALGDGLLLTSSMRHPN